MMAAAKPEVLESNALCKMPNTARVHETTNSIKKAVTFD
jgi:hypothetical protein